MRIPKISIVQATVDHSPFLARVVLDASRSQLDRGPFDIALQFEEREILDILEWMILSDLVTNCHFSNFFVAEADGQPIGALAGYDPGDPDLLPLGAALADAFSGLGHDEGELRAVIERIEAVGRCFPPVSPGTWALEWVGVAPAYRGRGICSQLMREALSAGADLGLKSAQITTYVGNQRAISAYKKAGFHFEANRHDARFEALLGVPGLVTMRCELPKGSALSTFKKMSSVPLVFEVSYSLSSMPML